MAGVEEITLSSDSEPEILDTPPPKPIKRISNTAVLSGLKAQLSQIRSFYPQKSPSKEGDTGNGNLRNGRSSPQSSSSSLLLLSLSQTSGNSKAVNGNGNRFGRPQPSSSIIPEEVVLDDDDDFEIEYGDEDDKDVAGDKINGGNVDDEDLQILESESSSKDNSVSAVKSNGFVADNGAPCPVESIDIDEDDEEEEVEAHEEYESRSQALVTLFGIHFGKAKKPRISTKKREKVRRKVQKHYERISNMSKAAHTIFQETIKSSIEELKINPKTSWVVIRDLLRIMEPVELAKMAQVPLSVRKDAEEATKQLLLGEAERQIRKLEKKIKILELKEIKVFDSDDEDDHNSPYILLEKTKKRIVDAYYRMCDISRCSTLLGRPVQKSIKLQNHGASSNYADIDSAVEKFVNKGGFLFIPDYFDIWTIVKDVNKTKKLGLSEEIESSLAQKIFENVVRIIKKRRQKDFHMSMLCHLPSIRNREPRASAAEEDEVDVNHPIEDPAENDVDLQEKLKANDRLKKSESEVFASFVQKQDEVKQPKEVSDEEKLNSSSPPSDSENVADEDDEDSSEGEEDGDDADGDDDDRAYQRVELTEGEDEEPETIRIKIPIQDDADDDNEDDEETSNEGGPATNDSESDTDIEDLDSVCEREMRKEVDKESAEVTKRKNSEIDNISVNRTDASPMSNSDPPPSKKMKSDENSTSGVELNGDSAVTEKLNIN